MLSMLFRMPLAIIYTLGLKAKLGQVGEHADLTKPAEILLDNVFIGCKLSAGCNVSYLQVLICVTECAAALLFAIFLAMAASKLVAL